MAKQWEQFSRIMEEYAQKSRKAELAADERRKELHRLIPELTELDAQLAGFGLRIMDVAMKGGNVQEGIAALQKENEELQEKRREILKKQGIPVNYCDVRYECSICKDRGYVDTKMCSCLKKKLAEVSLVSSGMAELIRRQTFENFSLDYYRDNQKDYQMMKSHLENLKKYAENFGSDSMTTKNLLFIGGTGLGKTHLSSALAGVLVQNGFDVFYSSAVGMISDFEAKRFGSDSSDGEAGRTGRYQECDLLILDDLGTEVVNQFTQSCLFDVLNTRLTKNKATVINTNLSMGELRNLYSDRLTSRLLGEYQLFPFCGTDIRKQKLVK